MTGTLLGVLLVAGLVALAQVAAVPVWNGAVEADHARAHASAVAEVDEASVRAAAVGTAATVDVPVGVAYPRRGPFVNPGPVSGRLATTAPAPLAIEGARAVEGGAARYWNGTTRTYDTQAVVASTAYNYRGEGRAVESVHEGSLTFTRHGEGATAHEAVDRFAVVSGTRITLVTIEGDVDLAGRTAATVDVTAVSTGGTPLRVRGDGGPIVLKLPTRLSIDAWQAALADEPAVVSVTDAPVPGRSDVRYAVVTLAPDVTYDLDVERVGVDAAPGERLPAYSVAVAGDGTHVVAGDERAVTVEVRDPYDNPLPGVAVRADAPAFAAAGATLRGVTTGTDVSVTGPEGRATFVYAAPSAATLTGHGLEAFDLVVDDPVHSTATTRSRTVPVAFCVYDTDSDDGWCDGRGGVAGVSGTPDPDASRDDEDDDAGDAGENDDEREGDAGDDDRDENDDERDATDDASDGSDVKAISYVAFCAVAPFDTAAVDVDVTGRNGDGEPIELSWASAVDLDAVVVKFATSQLVFEYPGSDDVAGVVGPAVDGGLPIDEPNSNPCPGTDGSGYKYEYDESTDSFGGVEEVA